MSAPREVWVIVDCRGDFQYSGAGEDGKPEKTRAFLDKTFPEDSPHVLARYIHESELTALRAERDTAATALRGFGNLQANYLALIKERDALQAKVEALRSALLIAQHALRAPIDDWKGEVERKALDAIAGCLAAKEEG